MVAARARSRRVRLGVIGFMGWILLLYLLGIVVVEELKDY
jgi:hypothetical protein